MIPGSPTQKRAPGRKFLLAAFIVIVFLSGENRALSGTAHPFLKGSSRFSLQVGSTRAYDKNYTAVGLGAGYFVTDGLEAEFEGDAWFGNTPHLYRLSPGLRYVLFSAGNIKPYAGIFYRRTFIENAEDGNEAGGRAGATILNGPRATFSVGMVYNAIINCDRKSYASCSEVYPELSFAMFF